MTGHGRKEKNMLQNFLTNSSISYLKMFSQDQMVNHWLILSPFMKAKYPVHITVFGVVTSEGDIMLLFIFLHGLSLNRETYIKHLEEVVPAWIERVATSSNRTSHTSRKLRFCWGKIPTTTILTSDCILFYYCVQSAGVRDQQNSLQV